MNILEEIKDKDFQERVLSSKRTVVVQFTSPECVICKTMAERIKKIAKDFFAKADFLSYNINANSRWQDLEIRVVPTLGYFKEGKLIRLQDTFPAESDIRAVLDDLSPWDKNKIKFIQDLEAAIDSEYLLRKFYKFISSKVKNGRVRITFKRFSEESSLHQVMLEKRLQEITNKPYQRDLNRFQGEEDFKPYSFSLRGALRMALEAEERALKFYKFALSQDKDKKLFKRLLKEEQLQHKFLQSESNFVDDKEFSSVLKEHPYLSFIGKTWI